MTLRLHLLFILLAALPTIGPGQTPLRGPDKVPDRATLSAAIDRFGEIPVMVTLVVDQLRPEHELSDADLARQRQRIRQAQLAVRRVLPPAAMRTMREYQTMPYLRLLVDTQTLQLLTTLPEVASVVEDRLSAPELTTSLEQIGAPYLWRSGHTGSGQTVVVLDTGAETTHPFLSDAIVAEACFSTTYAQHGATSLCPGGAGTAFTAGAAADCDSAVVGCGHGTHVAGIAAGRTTNRYGVAPEANLIPIQVFSRFENPEFCGGADRSPCVLSYTSDQLAALEHVRLTLRFQHTIAAVNMSLGGGLFTAACDDDQRAPIIADLRAAGIATVIASGNNASTNSVSAPGCISTAITVGAVNASDQVASFSNSSVLIDLLAPGVAINASRLNGTYAALSGTSMAAPHVSGALALLRQQYPSETVDQLQARLTSSGVAVTDIRNGIVKSRISLAQGPAAVHFAGNGSTGFGGTLGGGSLAVRETAFGLELTFTRGAGDFNDYLVVYADAGADGFRSTATLSDLGDTHRKAIRLPNHILDFAPGFTATHAFVLNRQFGGLWQLTSGGAHTFVATGLAFESSRSATQATYTLRFPREVFGQTPLQNLQFGLAAVYVNPDAGDAGNGFMSNEGIGRGLPAGAVNVGGASGTRTALRSYFRYPDALQGGEALTQAGGHWSASATWLHGSPPLDGDSVVVAHPLTLDAPVHLGAGGAAGAARPGQITVRSGISLHSGVGLLTYAEGAGIRFERMFTAPDFGEARTGWWTAFASPVGAGSLAGAGGFLDRLPTQGFPGSDWPAAPAANVITWQNAATGSWQPPASNVMTPGRGHFVYLFERRNADDPSTVVDYTAPRHLTGPENAPDVAGFAFPGLVYNGVGANDSWNLLGNPFAAGIRWDEQVHWERENVSEHAWIWDPVAGQHLLVAPQDEQLPGVTAAPVIAPFQAFWVRATGATPALRVMPGARTTDAANAGRFRTGSAGGAVSAAGPVSALILEFVRGGMSARTALRFLPEGDVRMDRHAEYLPPVSSQNVILFTKSEQSAGFAKNQSDDDGAATLVQMLPAEGDQVREIALVLKTTGFRETSADDDKTIDGQLRWSGLESVPEGMQVLLIDPKTRSQVSLTHGFDADARVMPVSAAEMDAGEVRYMLRIIPAGATSDKLFTTEIPIATTLEQNYPNPFNPTTRIAFRVGGNRCEGALCEPEAGAVAVRLAVYDLLGREVAVLVDASRAPGSYVATFDGSRLASGIYIYRITVGSQVVTRRMTLVK